VRSCLATSLHACFPHTYTENELEGLEDETVIKSLGTIEVLFKEGVTRGVIPFIPREIPAPKPLYEKLKKAGGHRVQSGGEVAQRSQFLDFVWNGALPHKFIFQYRPTDMLQALDIMPREHTPAGTRADVADGIKPDETNAETLDGDQTESDEDEAVKAEMNDLEKRLGALRDRKKRKPLVKLEGSHGRHKRAKVEEIQGTQFFAESELIDLT